MGLNSINTNVAAYYAQSNISKSSNMASSSIARLSSGNRIVRAADDVAAMSAGTSLRTNVTTLKMALVNTSQGSSLLQVADGALSQATDILQRQKAISVQAGSGSLTSQERSFLNQEFQNLTKEIDRIVDNTNFNGVTLLNGSLSEKVDVTQVDTKATSATASITWSTSPAAGEDLIMNGITFNAVAPTAALTAAGGVIDYNLGTTIAETIDNLVTRLNSIDLTLVNNGSITQAQYDSISQATYSRSGNSLIISADRGGAQGNVFRIDGGSSALDGSGTGIASVSGAGASSTMNLLTTNGIAATSVSTNVVGTTLAAPFVAGILTGTVGGYTTQTLATIAAGDTLQTITDKINARTSITGVNASIVGHSGAYNLQFEYAEIDPQAGGAFDLVLAGAALGGMAAVTLVTATVTTNNINYTLGGSSDLGIGAGDTVGRGVMGDSILTDQNQQKASVAIIFPEIADGDLLNSSNFGKTNGIDIRIANGTSGAVQFFFSDGGNGPTEANVGSTLVETLDNMVSTINNYAGSNAADYNMSQIHARRDGNNIIIETNDYTTSATNYASGATIAITQATAVTGGSVTNSGNLSNGVNGGVTTSGVTNKDFIGTLKGFTSTYSGTTDTVSLSIKVGEHTYTATNVDTTPSANTKVRLSSGDGGGFFDVEMAASKGQSVNSQSDADAIATRLNAAFSSLTFYQNHEISSFTGNAPILTDGAVTGSLIGTAVSLQGTDFSSITIDKIRVTSPSGSNENGKVVFTINGEDYTTDANVGNQFGAHADIKLVSASDADKFLTIHTGDVAIEFDTAAKAASFQTALEGAFGVGDGSAELKFQVGVTTEDTLSVGMRNISTSKIFGGETLDVLTAENAAKASDLIDAAIDMVTSVRAEVGAMQSRFDFATANIESSIQNQDAARGTLLDTDVAAESTKFSTAQVQLQAGIAVLAQANQLPQNLLKLIG